MRDTYRILWKLWIWADERGQDLVEYALVAGFFAVTAAAISPEVASSVSTIMSRIITVLPGSTGPTGG